MYGTFCVWYWKNEWELPCDLNIDFLCALFYYFVERKKAIKMAWKLTEFFYAFLLNKKNEKRNFFSLYTQLKYPFLLSFPLFRNLYLFIVSGIHHLSLWNIRTITKHKQWEVVQFLIHSFRHFLVISERNFHELLTTFPSAPSSTSTS